MKRAEFSTELKLKYKLKSKIAMETKSETPLMDLAPKMFTTIKSAQEALAKWIVPNSGITDSEVISELLGILDTQELVSKMREIEPIEPDWEEILWEESPNVEYTLFSEKHGIMEIKFKKGAIYQYFDFTKECWSKLSKAVSIGSFLHQEVKGKFRYCRVNGD